MMSGPDRCEKCLFGPCVLTRLVCSGCGRHGRIRFSPRTVEAARQVAERPCGAVFCADGSWMRCADVAKCPWPRCYMFRAHELVVGNEMEEGHV